MRKFGKLVTAMLVGAMLVQSTAMAAPIDELNEILANQAALQEQSLLSETLGLSELGETIGQNGIKFSFKGNLTEGTAETLGMGNEIPEGVYAELGFQVDLNAKNWLFDAGFGAEGSVLGNLALYGDSETLALTIPQLFVGAVSLHAGNLKQQYAGSALEMLIGEGTSERVPSLNTRFYPTEADINLISALGASLESALTAQFEGIADQIRVEKAGNSESMTYTMTCPVDVVMDFYESFYDGYFSLFTQFGLIDAVEIYEIEDEIEQMMDELSSVLPEELDMNFYTKDGLIEKIDYELYLDTTSLVQLEEEITYNTQSSDEYETLLTDVVEGELDEAGIVTPEPVVEAEPFKGTVFYEIIYHDPAAPADSMDINMTMMEEERGESIVAQIQLRTVQEGTKEEKNVSMMMSAMEETLYSGTIYTQSFDSSTGDFDAAIVFEVEEEPETAIAMKLDSTFTEVEAGKAFTWNLDGLTVEVDGEAIGVASQISISGEPEAVAAPQQERVLLDLTEDELMGLLMEVMQNAQTWMAQFEPERDITEDYAVDEVVSEEIIAAEADAISVIGGADGPTSIFLAGKAS